jgi:hypothetical protein
MASSIAGRLRNDGRLGTEPLGSVTNVDKVLAVAAISSTVMLVLGIMISAAEDRHRTSLSTYLTSARLRTALHAWRDGPRGPARRSTADRISNQPDRISHHSDRIDHQHLADDPDE